MLDVGSCREFSRVRGSAQHTEKTGVKIEENFGKWIMYKPFLVSMKTTTKKALNFHNLSIFGLLSSNFGNFGNFCPIIVHFFFRWSKSSVSLIFPNSTFCLRDCSDVVVEEPPKGIG